MEAESINNDENSSLCSNDRTVLIIDGSYAQIGARRLGRLDYCKLRIKLENLIGRPLDECWFFDNHNSKRSSGSNSGASTSFYTALKLAPPNGPQFQLKLYEMKDYNCHCPRCNLSFQQRIQKGVDNGIATKMLSLAYENVCDRILLFAGDGDFYDSLNHIKNVLRKDLWVLGYNNNTVSADLQQVSSRVLWIEDFWGDISEMSNRKKRSQEEIEKYTASSIPRKRAFNNDHTLENNEKRRKKRPLSATTHFRQYEQYLSPSSPDSSKEKDVRIPFHRQYASDDQLSMSISDRLRLKFAQMREKNTKAGKAKEKKHLDRLRENMDKEKTIFQTLNVPMASTPQQKNETRTSTVIVIDSSESEDEQTKKRTNSNENDSSSWICLNCTIINDSNVKKCSLCAYPRPRPLP